MGAESSKLESLFRSLDSDRDGYLTAEDLHQWICDEHMLGNPQFDPLLNGMRNPRELADAFLKYLDSDGDGRASKADLVTFCRDLGADDMAELACSLVASDAAAIASVTANANGTAGSGSTLSLPPTGRGRANSAFEASTALLTAVSPSVLLLAQSRRERLLARIFAALDSNGNGVLERAEVDAWMEAEARMASQLSRDRQAGAPSQLEPGMQYLLTASQRADVWKALNTRPVERPTAASAPATPNPSASASSSSPAPLHQSSPSAPAPPQPAARKQQGTLSALANFSPWSSSRVITMPDRPSAHQNSSGNAPAAALTPPVGPPLPNVAVTTAPVRIDDVRRFFARWSVRELRAHFADRVSEAEERARRRLARAKQNPDGAAESPSSPDAPSDGKAVDAAITSPSLGGAEVDAESAAAARASSLLRQTLAPFLPQPLTPDVSSLLSGISAATDRLEELSRESLRKARENLEVNACKRQLNAEIASIEHELLALDQTRLVLCNSVNDAQNDWNLLSHKEKEAKRRVEIAAGKLDSISTRYESAISDISAIQSDLEKAKVTSKVLADELTYLSNLDKNFPAHRKQLQTQIEKHESMTAASESALADVRKVKASYEAEMAAIDAKLAEEKAKRESKEREKAEAATPSPKEDQTEAASTTSNSNTPNPNPNPAAAPTPTPSTTTAASATESSARRGSTGDAASTAGSSSSLSSLSPSRSRRASVSSGSDAPSSSSSASSSSSHGHAGMVSQVKGMAAGTLGSISSMLPSALTRPLEAVSSAVSSALASPTPSAAATAPPVSPPVAAPVAAPVPDSPYVLMRARMASKLKEITRQEFEALSHLATIRDVLIHLRAQLRQEQDQMRDPASVTERIRVVKGELESKKGAVVSLNAKQVSLQRTLSSIDAERKNAHEEQRSHERAVAALHSRLQSLTSMITKGEDKMANFGAQKEGLTDQMRLKLSTQQIVQQQQQDSVLHALANLNDRFAHTLATLSHKHSKLEAALEAHLRRTEYATRRAKMAELGIELAETEGEGPHIQAPDVLDPLTGLMRPATSSPSSANRTTGGYGVHPSTAPASTSALTSFTFDRVSASHHKSSVPLHLQSTQQRQLHALFAAGHANPLMSLALAYRSAPFPCVSYVSIEVQLPPPINSSFVMLTSNNSGSGSGGGGGGAGASGGNDLPALPPLPGSDVCVSHGVLRIAHNTMLYDRDVHTGNVQGDDPSGTGSSSSGSSHGALLDPELVAMQPALQSLSRFCIDITRDVLDAYYLDRYGHREDRLAQEEDDSSDDEEEEVAEAGKGSKKQSSNATKASPSDSSSSDVTQAAAPALPADPDTVADSASGGPARESMSPKASTVSASPPLPEAPSATSSLLLSFRPGYRNRFLFNVDTNEPASTAPPQSALSLSLGGGGSSSASGGSNAGHGHGASSAPGEALRALTGSSLGGAGSDGPKHLVKLTADTRTVRRIYNTLHVYMEKRLANERAAATRAAELTKAKTSPPAAAGASGGSGTPNPASSTSSSNPRPGLGIRAREAAKSMYQRDTSVYVEGTSDLIHDSHLRTLVKAAPSRHSLSVWGLVYSMARHGVSRTRFFDMLAEVPCAIIVFRDMKGAVFGGFASQPFNPAVSRGYYGSGECYVFKIHQPADAPPASAASVGLGPNPSGTVQVFRWRGHDEYFMITGDSYLAMGGGGAYAWQVDNVFRYGSSGPCTTYESPVLASAKNFELNEMEAPIKEAAEMVTEGMGSTLYPRPSQREVWELSKPR